MSQLPEKNRVSVKIYEEEYTMRSSASPEYMRRLASYVDEKMKQIGQTNSRLGINKVAVLTSVNLADELFRLRKEVRELENLLKKKNSK
ncbi:MAG TPA: cell division protein ZapA [Oscillospiraceae bacterium]|nr:cell division protein ZapA [Oscillospiraceae bacterium]